ncbi:MAG: copper chaperone PCu(A)C [Pseudomonadota bacterium]|nr:copper chaperone PCu(A)C [Pseudomonadota bacterium]
MRAPIVTACAALALSACSGTPDEPKVIVEDAVVTLPAVPGRPGAAYFELRANRTPINLVSLTSPLVRKIELHESRTRNGKSSMKPLDSTAFPGNGVMQFKPGGKHAMLTGIDKSVKEGSKIPITFTFDPAPAVTVEAEVRGPGGAHEGD